MSSSGIKDDVYSLSNKKLCNSRLPCRSLDLPCNSRKARCLRNALIFLPRQNRMSTQEKGIGKRRRTLVWLQRFSIDNIAHHKLRFSTPLPGFIDRFKDQIDRALKIHRLLHIRSSKHDCWQGMHAVRCIKTKVLTRTTYTTAVAHTYACGSQERLFVSLSKGLQRLK